MAELQGFKDRSDMFVFFKNKNRYSHCKINETRLLQSKFHGGEKFFLKPLQFTHVKIEDKMIWRIKQKGKNHDQRLPRC